MLCSVVQLCLLFMFVDIVCCGGVGMLYPQDTESRDSKLLDGVWKFRADFSASRKRGFEEEWWRKPLAETGPVIDMPVPSSYNDITQDKALRDFIGWVWYDRSFYVSSDWGRDKRVVLRFDSAHYNTIVWVNGVELMSHSGGHLPFEAEVQGHLNFLGPNYVTVAINNTLSPTTLPPGSIQYQTDTSRYPPGYFVQVLQQMDFFNYAGIHRHVHLYTTPLTYIDDITIVTDVVHGAGHVTYSVVAQPGTSANMEVMVLDAAGQRVASSHRLSDTLVVNSPTMWWPLGMNQTVGYLYTLQVNVSGDIYRQTFGIKTVKVTENQLLINGRPFYCLGVGKHEDTDVRGKGLDYAWIIKDFNLLRWLGVNCIRTSHYPYAEEILQLADRQGVAVIDESPGVGILRDENLGNESLTHHLEVMSEMVRRDKNYASVIMWSVANEPNSTKQIAVPYFRMVLNHTKYIDPAHRPVTFVTYQPFQTDVVVSLVDVICLNVYFGWYTDTGHLEVIQRQVHSLFAGFRNLYKKPIIMTEYGADTIEGLHRVPSFAFTEEYQEEFLQEYFQEFDVARQEFLVGEMVWNFADFITPDGIIRVGGNRKGILTRDRQPKKAAYLIRERYHAILNSAVWSKTEGCGRSSQYTVSPHTYLPVSGDQIIG